MGLLHSLIMWSPWRMTVYLPILISSTCPSILDLTRLRVSLLDNCRLITPPPANADADWFVAFLCDREWTTARAVLELCGLPVNEDNKRWIRKLADESKGRIAGHQKGYKLTGSMTGDEYHEVYGGLNYYFHGHRLKLQTGLSYVSLNDASREQGEYHSWSWVNALRISW